MSRLAIQSRGIARSPVARRTWISTSLFMLTSIVLASGCAAAPKGTTVAAMALHIEKHGDWMCGENLPPVAKDKLKTTYNGVGTVDVFVVLYDFKGVRAVSFGLVWPETWGNGRWTDCGSIRLGTIASPGDMIRIAWKDCIKDSVPLIVGWLTLTVNSPGTISVIPSDTEGSMAMVDCNEAAPRMNEIMMSLKAGAGGVRGDDPERLSGIRNRTWHIRPDSTGDVPKIDQALRLAGPGDTILVAQGIYKESVLLKKGVVVLGSWDKGFAKRDLSTTPSIIDATGLVTGVKATFAEDSTAVLDGFVIKGAAGEYGGGIVLLSGSSPKLLNLVISGNSASLGGGIFCHSSSPVIRNVTIVGNKANRGGGICCIMGSSPIISNATIVANEAPQGAAIAASNGSSPYVEKSIIASHAIGNAVSTEDKASRVSLSCCDLWSNLPSDFGGQATEGMELKNNISKDPGFVDASKLDFSLKTGSPVLSLEGCGRIGSRHGRIRTD